jgi:signal transduction histidine kinase
VPVVRRDYKSSFDGRHRMGVWVPIPGIGWAATATTPVDEAFAMARSDTWRDVIILVSVILASLLATLLVSESIMRRVRTLERAALDITSGDLTARSRLKGSDELAVAGLAFDAMADRIQGLDTERTQFLQTAAHELRNPMASVTGLLSLMLKRMNEGRRVENQADLMEVMKQEILRLSTLLSEMLEAFRTQEGQLPLKWRPVGLFQVITSALEPFRLMAGTHEFRLRVADGAEVTVLGDKRRLEDLVRNLLSNAVKYSPEGGEIEIALDVEDDCGRISVSDHGIGVPQDQLARIFERFYRATNLSGRDPGGMGLGLYICRDIALAHGGRIWAESTPENGTTIHVEIPRYERRSR